MSKTQNIAVMVDVDWPLKHHHEVIGGIQRYARERGGWELFSDYYPERALDRYDAVIGQITPELLEKAAKTGIPLVNTWFSSPVADKVPTVAPDYDAMARMGADHLVARGFRRFGFLGFTQTYVRTVHRAFKEYLRQAGYPCSSILVSDRYNTSVGTWARFSERLENWADAWSTPIGVFSAPDGLGRHLATVCQYKGIAIPHDVAIIGHWNEPNFCLLAEPSLTSIEVGYEQVGYRAAELLDQLLEGEPPPEEPVLLPPAFLVPRQSTDAYIVDDPLMAVALRFIAEHSHERIRVSDVARGISVTRRTLERRFAEHGERTVAQEILHFRIERLKRLLVQTDQPIKYLAHEVGFIDAKQMHAVFSRVEGIPPSAYREQQRAEGRP